jgi:hypothetical protein
VFTVLVPANGELEQGSRQKHLDSSMSISTAFCRGAALSFRTYFLSSFAVSTPAQLGVGKKGHEAEVHVELLVAVEESQTGVLGEEVDLDFLVSAHHHYIFMYS